MLYIEATVIPTVMSSWTGLDEERTGEDGVHLADELNSGSAVEGVAKAGGLLRRLSVVVVVATIIKLHCHFQLLLIIGMVVGI